MKSAYHVFAVRASEEAVAVAVLVCGGEDGEKVGHG